MKTNTVHSICVVGADDDLGSRITTLLLEHVGRLEARWKPASQADADVLLIDPDSVYGHMDWLRAQSSGRLAIACTGNPDAFAKTPLLRKPVASEELVMVLNRIGSTLGARPKEATVAAAAPRTAIPTAATDITMRAPLDPPQAPAAPQVAETPSEPQLLYFIGNESPLQGKTRLTAPGLPQILIDPQARQWHADSNLKALAGWCTQALTSANIGSMSDIEFANAAANLTAQPHSRLVWLAHLFRGDGQLAPALDIGGRFKLARWPQSEREFPKHFRIATVMLKEAAPLADIAAQSGASAADVADFINAYSALGFIEHEMPELAAEEGARRGLFGRARKNSPN